MKYKRITLDRSRDKLFFSEYVLPHEREDEGEYIFINSAIIYKDSDSAQWKHKMLAKFREETEKEIAKFRKMIQDLDSLEREIELHERATLI